MYKREHVSISDMKDIFKAHIFIDFTHKMKLKTKVDLTTHPYSFKISSIFHISIFFVIKNTCTILKTDKSIKKVGIAMKNNFDDL